MMGSMVVNDNSSSSGVNRARDGIHPLYDVDSVGLPRQGILAFCPSVADRPQNSDTMAPVLV